MSEQEQPPQSDAGRGSPVLPYAPPDPNGPAGGVSFIVQFVLGMVASPAAVALSWSVAGALGPGAASGVLVLAFVALIVSMFVAGLLWRWPGYVAGVLTTGGLVLLAIGLCGAIMR